MQTSKTLFSIAPTALLLVVTCLAENLQPPPAGTLLVQQQLQPQTDMESDRLLLNEKRSSWNNLHSSWGKRHPIDDIITARLLNNMIAREGLGDIDKDTLNDLLVNELLDAGRQQDDDVEELYRPAAEKRAWKNMNGAWGKRVSGDWNKFRGE